MGKVFVSYVRENQREVDRLIADLRSAGVSSWLDRRDIPPGTRWDDAIRNGIRGGDFFLACFSIEYHARERTYMNEELVLAVEELRQRPTDSSWFIPVRLSLCEIPDRPIDRHTTIRDLQYVDMFSNWDGGVSQILSVIRPRTAPFIVPADWFSQLTHDLAGQLAHITSLADRLTQPEHLAASGLRTTMDIKVMADIASLYVRNFHTAAQASQPDDVLYRARFDLVPIIYRVVATVRTVVAAARDLRFDVQVTQLGHTILADAARITQLVYNIVNNAAKYAFDHTTITIDDEGSTDAYVLINVRTQGLAIASIEEDLIFERSYRSASAIATSQSGAGMGLYVARLIARQHGGDISVESARGSTIFHIRLPRL